MNQAAKPDSSQPVNQCTLCMTDNHPGATVCVGCGAVKQLVRPRLTTGRSLAMFGCIIVGMVLAVTVGFLAGMAAFGVAIFVARAPGKHMAWVKYHLSA
jgi:hypothetical protein